MNEQARLHDFGNNFHVDSLDLILCQQNNNSSGEGGKWIENKAQISYWWWW